MTDNKRIAKNALFLYFRMFLTMGVGLYTSRVVLNVLGVVDFGIYNVVGGIIIMFSFLNNALTGATQRFLTFELGKNNISGFKNVFSLSISSHVIISLIIILLSETIGVWFLNQKMNISDEKINAANCVFQLSILAFIINIIRTPYNAAIIAHERMSFYAGVSVIEVFLKLVIVSLLNFINYDKLILYSFLTAAIGIVISFIYYYYCRVNFKECRYNYHWNKKLFIKLTSFSIWSMFGNLSIILTTHGVNILMNIFFGVVVNSAMGIANQVSSLVYQFVGNFQIAFNPQITKYYANNEFDNLFLLVFRTSKLSFFLLFLITMPLLLDTDTLLIIWLKIPPENSIQFTRLMILSLLIETISGPLWMIVQSTGKIKKYQLIISSILSLNIIISYIFFYLGYNVIFSLYIKIIVSILLLIARLFLLFKMINFPSVKFFYEVLVPLITVTVISVPLPFFISYFTDGITGLFYISLSSIISCILSIYFVGINKNEKKYLKNIILKRLK